MFYLLVESATWFQKKEMKVKKLPPNKKNTFFFNYHKYICGNADYSKMNQSLDRLETAYRQRYATRHEAGPIQRAITLSQLVVIKQSLISICIPEKSPIPRNNCYVPERTSGGRTHD